MNSLRFACWKQRRIVAAIWLFAIAPAARATTAPVAHDTYISSANPGQNFGSATTLNIGGGSAALIGLDLSPLPAGLTSANIQRATLTVFVNKVFTAGSLDLAPLTKSWDEAAVTYSAQPSSGPVLVQGVPVSTPGSYVTFDITNLMQAWAAGAPNYGVMISASTNNPATVNLDSKESTSTSHPAYAEVTIVSMGPAGPQGTTGAAGATGPAGPQGVPGPAGMNWCGAWDPSIVYHPNDAVSFHGNSWIALNPPGPVKTINIASQPRANNPLWAMLAAAGATGPAGPAGPNARIYATAAQTFQSDIIGSQVNLPNVDFSNGVAAAGSSIVIQTAGTYVITGQVAWSGKGSGVRQIDIVVERNRAFVDLAVDNRLGLGTGNLLHQSVTAIVHLQPGDPLKLFAAQTSGGDLATASDSAVATASLSVAWVGN